MQTKTLLITLLIMFRTVVYLNADNSDSDSDSDTDIDVEVPEQFEVAVRDRGNHLHVAPRMTRSIADEARFDVAGDGTLFVPETDDEDDDMGDASDVYDFGHFHAVAEAERDDRVPLSGIISDPDTSDEDEDDSGLDLPENWRYFVPPPAPRYRDRSANRSVLDL